MNKVVSKKLDKHYKKFRSLQRDIAQVVHYWVAFSPLREKKALRENQLEEKVI